MANPRVLLCDTDVLVQLFLTKEIHQLLPLRVLNNEYGVQSAIVEEVEIELSWIRRYTNRFEPDLRKARANGTIELLDEAAFSRYVPSHLAKTVFNSFQLLGQEHNKYSDRGEAYTLAAAVTLGEPALSNDITALRALETNGLKLPSPVLRTFDLLVLCYQIGSLTENDCDKVRQELVTAGERIPEAFERSSFVAGLKRFCPRILDGSKPTVGAADAPSADFQKRIYIS